VQEAEGLVSAVFCAAQFVISGGFQSVLTDGNTQAKGRFQILYFLQQNELECSCQSP